MSKTNGTLWNRNFTAMLIVTFFNALAFSMISPIIVKYAVSLNVSLGLAGLIAGLYSITALFIRPISGLLSDRSSKRKLMLTSSIGCFIAIIGYAVSNGAAMLILFRILHGVCFAIFSTASTALSVSFVPQDRIGEGIGYLGLGSILSNAVGPSIGLWLVERYGFTVFFFIPAATTAIAAVLPVVFNIKDTMPKQKKKFALSDLLGWEVMVYGLCNGMFSMSNGVISTYLALFAEQRNIGNVGIYFTVVSVFLIVIRPVAGKITDKKGPNVVVIVSYLCTALSLFTIGRAWSLWPILLAAVFKAIGQGAGQPAIQTICLKKMGEEKRGVAVSTWYLGADIGQGIGTMFGGSIAEEYGYETLFSGVGSVLCISLITFICYRRYDLKASRRLSAKEEKAKQVSTTVN